MGKNTPCYCCGVRIPSNRKKEKLSQPILWECYRRFSRIACIEEDGDKYICKKCYAKITSVRKDPITGNWTKKAPMIACQSSPFRTRSKGRLPEDDPVGDLMEIDEEMKNDEADASSARNEDVMSDAVNTDISLGQSQDSFVTNHAHTEESIPAEQDEETFIGDSETVSISVLEQTQESFVTNHTHTQESIPADYDEEFLFNDSETVSISVDEDLLRGTMNEGTTPASQQEDYSQQSSSSTASLSRPRRLQGIKSVSSTQKRCFICRKTTGRNRIPKEALCQVWMEKSILLPQNNRCCAEHLDNKKFTAESLEAITSDKDGVLLSDEELCSWLKDLTGIAKDLQEKKSKRFDFDDAESVKEEDYPLLTGISKENFSVLQSQLNIYNTSNRSAANALGIYLMLLRLNLSQNALANLFGIKNQSTVSDIITTVAKAFQTSFIPKHLGMRHISRDEALQNHSRKLYYDIYEEPDPTRMFLILDGTYIFVEKPMDFVLQKLTYSGQKNRNLIKPFMIVFPDGHILDAAGPYFATGKNNDAGILRAIMDLMDGSEGYFQPGDHVILDRGFRDIVPYLKKKGLIVHMPELLGKDEKQFSTKKGNKSRIVTMGRWVVESVNGRIKRKFKLLREVIPGGYLEKTGLFFNSACALINAFLPPLNENTPDHDEISRGALELVDTSNNLQQRVRREKMDRDTKAWKKASHEDCIDFPHLTVQDLKKLTLGVYQVGLAKRYTSLHYDDSSNYQILLNLEFPNIVRAKIESRFTSNKTHELWISFDPSKSGAESIEGYYCKCRQGARTVGTCAHICSVLWFLGYQRHQPSGSLKIRTRKLDIMDAGTLAVSLSSKSVIVAEEESQSSRHSWSQTTLGTEDDAADFEDPWEDVAAGSQRSRNSWSQTTLATLEEGMENMFDSDDDLLDV